MQISRTICLEQVACEHNYLSYLQMLSFDKRFKEGRGRYNVEIALTKMKESKLTFFQSNPIQIREFPSLFPLISARGQAITTGDIDLDIKLP